MAPSTLRLYFENPRAKTALATVSGHASGGFLLDRTLFHAALPGYHHAQPPDLGHLLAEGHKLKLTKVAWDPRGRLVHRTDGPLPALGAKAQLHLDAPRRLLQARAHAAMHLLVAAVGEARAELLEPPRVVGGGEVRLHTRQREAPDLLLPRLLARAQQLVDAREPVQTRWAPRDEAARLVTQHILPLPEIMPGEPTLRLAHTGSHSVLPCDAPLVDHTWQIGRLRLAYAQPRGETVRWGVRVQQA